MNIYLETRRLVLRRFTEGDANRLFELDSDPQVLRHIGTQRLADAAAYRRHIRSAILCYYATYQGYGFWATLEKAGGRFVGWFCLRPALDCRWAAELGYGTDEVEIDCRLRQSAWGKGYATELARALVAKAFTELGVTRLVASAELTHAAAIRVMEKTGLRRLPGTFALRGRPEPIVKYTLIKRQFRASTP
jgi:RimJ/RimL family protein N-acetyltransferase